MTIEADDLRESATRFAYPNPMPEPPPRGMTRNPIAARFRIWLRDFFAPRADALVAGMGYLCADLDDPESWVVPDAMIAFGVDPEAILVRNGYVISEVGKAPDFVFDIALGENAGAGLPPELVAEMGLEEDIALKRDTYAGFGVLESWTLDIADERRADQLPLSGAALTNGEYRPIEIVREPSGVLSGRSAVLGIDLCWDEGELRLRVPTGGEYLRSHLDEKRGRLEAEAKWLETETARRYERKRRLSAEAEIARLRERLKRGGGGYERNGGARR